MNSATHRRSVLVVDDEPLVCNALKLLLERFGFDAITAGSGLEALDCFGRRQFHLVITDFSMPRMSGAELAVAIKAKAPQQPILMLTAYAERFWSQPPLPAVDKILAKPISISKLQEVIKLASALGETGTAAQVVVLKN